MGSCHSKQLIQDDETPPPPVETRIKSANVTQIIDMVPAKPIVHADPLFTYASPRIEDIHVDFGEGQTDISDQRDNPANQFVSRNEEESPVRADYILESTISKPKKRKPVLVFDMDETIIHSVHEHESGVDKMIRIPVMPETQKLRYDYSVNYIEVFIHIRPHLLELLNSVRHFYEIIIWTASPQLYADKVLDYIEEKYRKNYSTKRKLFKKRFYEQHCVSGIKDLTKLEIDLDRIIAIDDIAANFSKQLKNVLVIPEYHGKSDNHLKKLERFLVERADIEDQRVGLRIDW